MSTKNIKKVIVFDLETSGLPEQPCFGRYHSFKQIKFYDSSRIIQIGAQVYDINTDTLEHSLIKEYDLLIKPEGFEIDNSHIHGITHEHAMKNGMTFAEAIKLFSTEFKPASLIVAHNIGFDSNVLLSELFRRGYTKEVSEFRQIPLFCTSSQTEDLLKIRFNSRSYKQPKLIELYKWLFNKDLEVKKLHNALHDTRALSKCFIELLKRKYFKLD